MRKIYERLEWSVILPESTETPKVVTINRLLQNLVRLRQKKACHFTIFHSDSFF